MILDHLGCTKKWNEPFLSPLQPVLATLHSQNALEMGLGPKINQKWIKNVFFHKYFWTIWGAQTSRMSPF